MNRRGVKAQDKPMPPERRGRVLAVDDQPQNLELLKMLLAPEGYEVLTADDGEEALSLVEEQAPDCIILDVMMPGISGFEVCRRLKDDRKTYLIPIVMLTALSEVEDKIEGLEAGADDFLTKPVSRDELLLRVRSLVKIRRLREELDTSESIIYSMVNVLESKDPETAGHSRRVAANAVRLARRLSLPPERIESIAKGGVLHDLGKIGLPDRIFNESQSIEPRDLDLYRRHPELGEQILAPFLTFAGVRALVRHHHERLNGTGYPDGLSGAGFPLDTEILSLANRFDVLCLQESSPEVAAERLREEAQRGEYHSSLVEELLTCAIPPEPDPGKEGPTPWEELLPVPTGTMAGTILLGEPSPNSRTSVRSFLGRLGFTVISAASGEAILRACREAKPELVLLRTRLPDMDGFAVCRQIKSRPQTEFLPVLLITSGDDRKDRKKCLEAGADDFLTLPLNRFEVSARLKSLLRLKLYFRNLEEHQSVILSLAQALEAKDPYTRGHSERVGLLAARMARKLGEQPGECSRIRMAGQLHDIGKIGIPELLLNKPGKLTPEEFEAVMTHSERGEAICRPLRAARSVLAIIRHHHERYDGSGYPDRLKGDEIPRGARILAMADAYDALTSKRSYRKNMSSRQALDLLVKETEEGLWDQEICQVLVTIVQRELGE